MKRTLPASHLLRQFMLFALTILLLLAVVRAAYGLWLFPDIARENAFVPLYVQGLRFDLSLIGLICLVPITLGSALSVSRFTRGLAKFIIVFFLAVSLFLVLVLELLTPWFISGLGVRPDFYLIGSLDNPLTTLKSVFVQHTVPLIIGSLICVLILTAFWIRSKFKRFLRHRVSAPAGILLSVVGGFVCLVAIWSNYDLRQRALSPTDSLISADVTVNELAMNTTYKAVYSLLWLSKP